ncbi:MAG: ABC transporter ATP-binding protein [Gammaproteobacteria bacterium]
MATVSLTNVCKSFGDQEVVHSLNLEIADGEFLVLLGPSGCGKSTTLRMVAGLEEASAGEIAIDGKVVNDVDPKDRNIAMVFQNYALYPHMTVFQNLAFGLRMQGMKKPEIGQRVRDVAEVLRLSGLLQRVPAELSGGQRQRVAMGRAMVRTPVVFLFDEPLSNLDAVLRTEMRAELKRLHMQLETTSIYVTHDQVEAMTLADRIVVMRDGHVEQIGTPKAIFQHPDNLFVAQFIGNPQMNVHAMNVSHDEGSVALVGDGLRVPLPESLVANGRADLLEPGRKVMMGIRPTDIRIVREEGIQPAFEAEMELTELLGAESLIEFSIGTLKFRAIVADDYGIQPGEAFRVSFDHDKVHIFEC